MPQMRVVDGASPSNGCPARRWRAAPARPKGSAEMAALSVPRARTCESNLPPDEEYGRDGRTRCAAEIRPA